MLIPHNYHLTRSKVGCNYATASKSIIWRGSSFFLVPCVIVVLYYREVFWSICRLLDGFAKEELTKKLVTHRLDQIRLFSLALRDFFTHFVNAFRKDSLNDLNHIVGELKDWVLRPIVYRQVDWLRLQYVLPTQYVLHVRNPSAYTLSNGLSCVTSEYDLVLSVLQEELYRLWI